MILIREFDQLAIELRKGRRIHGALHPYVGEEAVAVGACAALRPTDRITSTHRGHGHCIAKGADINRMMSAPLAMQCPCPRWVLVMRSVGRSAAHAPTATASSPT